MKKILLIIISTFLSGAAVFADSYMPLPDAVNSRMFSTEGTKPLMNLERTHFTNQAIMQIESKQKPQRETEAKIINDTVEPIEKTKFKDYFKGFVVEW